MRLNISKRAGNERGQAAVETIFCILILLLLFLASAQILYASLVAQEAVRRTHANVIEFIREQNENGNKLQTTVKEIEGEIEAEPGQAYARVLKNWSLFRGSPHKQPRAHFERGREYEAIRGIFAAGGPLKGEGGEVNAKGEGRSAFGVRRGIIFMPKSDGDGWNDSGKATRNEELDRLCQELGIANTYF